MKTATSNGCFLLIVVVLVTNWFKREGCAFEFVIRSQDSLGSCIESFTYNEFKRGRKEDRFTVCVTRTRLQDVYI